MKRKPNALLSFLVLVLSAFMIWPDKAYAYLDPGSGSYILQLVFAGMLAALFAIKSFWRAALTWLRSLFNKSKKTENS